MRALRAIALVMTICTQFAAQQVWAGTDTVATSKALRQAIAQADPSGNGHTIRLQPGVYDNVVIRNVKGPLRLVAADPKNPPRLTKVQVRHSADIRFEGLHFDFVFDPATSNPWTSPFQFQESERLVFDKLRIEGDLMQDTGSDGDGYPAGKGLVFVKTRGVEMRNSEIFGFFVGFNARQSSRITLRDTHLHGMRKDAIVLVEVTDVLIENNRFTDFNRSFAFDDHPDMIQLTSHKAKTPSERVTIRGNLFNSGRGAWSQTIFMRNKIVDTGQAGPEMFYRDFRIEDNVIVNAHLSGIILGETQGAIIRNNTLIRNRASEEAGMSHALASPRIRVAKASQDVLIAQNAAYRIPKAANRTWAVHDNVVIQGHKRAAAGYYAQVFANALSGDPRDVSSFGYRKGGPLYGTGIGAPMLDARP